jgi:hypothetical protein
VLISGMQFISASVQQLQAWSTVQAQRELNFVITATLCSCRKGANDGALLLEALCSVGNSRSKCSIFHAGKISEPLPGAESVGPELQQQPASSSSNDTALMEGQQRSSKASRNDRYVRPTQGKLPCSEMGLSHQARTTITRRTKSFFTHAAAPLPHLIWLTMWTTTMGQSLQVSSRTSSSCKPDCFGRAPVLAGTCELEMIWVIRLACGLTVAVPSSLSARCNALCVEEAQQASDGEQHFCHAE